jgi:hypothetical protein
MAQSEQPRDRALTGILLTNLATLAVALWQDWSVLQLMWPFWIQSLVIGWYARQRMLKLSDFSTEGLRINGRSVEATPETLQRAAGFFTLHYGLFHLVYLFFLLALTLTTDAQGFIEVTNESTGNKSMVHIGHVHPFDFVIFAVLAAGFVRSHGASHREHAQADLANSPRLGTLMMLPYARIVPMHLTIILAIPLGGGALWFFVLLKTAADLLMHRVEHRLLQAGRTAPATATGSRRMPFDE